MATEHGDNPSLTGYHPHRHDVSKARPTRTINYMDRDLDLKVDNLAQAKDRAQLTATGAMSVVHVALLKEVLDKGKDNMRYFTVAISLICISLALQILAGILALVVSHLRSYYAKYKDDLIEDMFENLCCCRTVSNRAASSRKIARARHLTLGEDVIDGTELAERNVASDDEAKRQNEEDEPLAAAASQLWCCGCACGRNRVLSNYEYDVLEMYDEWGAEHTEMELLAAEADVQVPYLSDLLHNAKVDLQELEESKDNSEIDFDNKYQELRKKLAEIQNKKDIFEEAQRKLAVSTAKGDILLLRSDAVRRNRVLKLASFWQQMINYVFYVVFILNAFITGLGIAAN